MPNENDIQQNIQNLVENLSARAEREVPEYGDFAPVVEEIKNPDKNLSATHFAVKIYKPTTMDDEKYRCVEAIAYAVPKPYKAEMPLVGGYKDEILNKINSDEFAEKLNSVFAKLSKDLEDV